MNESTVEKINRQAAERRDRGERTATPASQARIFLLKAIAEWEEGNYDSALAAASIATAIVTVG